MDYAKRIKELRGRMERALSLIHISAGPAPG